MKTTPGMKLRGSACTSEVIVIRPASGDVLVTCCGQAMVVPDAAAAPGAQSAGGDNGIVLGKRYTDPASGLELLCTKPGPGPLAVDGRELTIRAAKPLPASD